MNPQTSLGGLVSSSSGTPTSGATDLSNLSGGADTTDLSSLIGDLGNTPLAGGSSSSTAQSFDPSLYEPGGIFSPTGGTGGGFASTPAVAEAQRDPSGQIPPDQTVDRTIKGDRATTQDDQLPTDTRSAGGDRAQPPGAPPAGPTGFGGDGGQAQPTAAGGAAPKSPLAQLAALVGAGGQKPQAPAGTRTAAVDQPAAAAPQPAGAAPGAAAPTQQPSAAAPAQRQAPSAGGTPAVSPVPSPQAGGVPAGVPPLLQAILNMLGLGGLTGGGAPLQGVAQQAYPQRQIAPVAPTAGLGPYARARAARGLPGKYDRPTQDEWTRNVSDGGGMGPAPGSTDEVSAPTDQQVRQSRLAGTDTAPTAGFSPVLQRERAKFREQLSDPRTKWETLAILSLEHAHDPAAVAESLLNRSDYSKTSLRNMIHSGFYGPVNFGLLGREIRRLQSNPQLAARLNAGLETALRGSNLIGGATDQGSGKDPNVGWRGGRVIRFGETYNDWGGGPGGHHGAELYRKQQQQRVRQGQEQVAMDITRRVPFTGGAEMEVGGGMIRRGAPASEYENLLDRLKRRDKERREAAAT